MKVGKLRKPLLANRVQKSGPKSAVSPPGNLLISRMQCINLAFCHLHLHLAWGMIMRHLSMDLHGTAVVLFSVLAIRQFFTSNRWEDNQGIILLAIPNSGCDWVGDLKLKGNAG